MKHHHAVLSGNHGACIALFFLFCGGQTELWRSPYGCLPAWLVSYHTRRHILSVGSCAIKSANVLPSLRLRVNRGFPTKMVYLYNDT